MGWLLIGMVLLAGLSVVTGCSFGDVQSAADLPGWLAHPPRWLAAAILISIVALALSFVGRQGLG